MAVGGTAPAVLERQVGAAMGPSYRGVARKDVIVILGATLGTTFEWYDFFLFGSLASTLASILTNQLQLGAIAVGHPYGMSGARQIGYALIESQICVVTMRVRGGAAPQAI
jgi:Thiolase, C-terminal domain